MSSRAEHVPAVPEGREADPAEARRVAETLAEFVLQAARDEELGARVRRAATSLHVHVGDDAGVTVRLDRTPVEAVARIEGVAEVELWLAPDVLLSCARGERPLQMAIMDGDVTFRGPVRKLLMVVPVLRTFDTSVWARRHE
ncbi:SCP2 sterol-binding domain-containing protein [Conexibacter sp. SYSU D00693]|uniref:SCP2 sterol-binding domain-containing protein n=1 Tax=Conexibacter sp. SYSU D00693 TaxID=2812560 RepID=UPI00196A1FA0|nr:SCP2 sterol-binding domain-containing protein [Conexibacter sp. SYSU D00693]